MIRMRHILILLFPIFAISCNSIQNEVEKSKEESTDSLAKAKIEVQQEELQTLKKPYNPYANAEADIQALIDSAKKLNKNIIIQAGGNWCIWCLRFEKFRTENKNVSKLIADHFLYYHLNYSEENKNEEVLNKLGNPGKLGYPVFVILDKNGERLHTQGSEELEEGDGYNEERVLAFLRKWIRN